MQAVERVGGNAHRRVEPERHLGCGHVIIDGLRNTHDRNPHLEELEPDLQSPVSADDEKTIQSEFLEVRDDFL